MPDRSELEALLGRVENGRGSDNRLDREIVDALAPHEQTVAVFWPLTSSLDAVIGLADQLLPDDFGIGLHRSSYMLSLAEHERPLARWAGEIWNVRREGFRGLDIQSSRHHEPARAMLAALLRSLIAESHPAEPLKVMPA